MVKPRVGYLSHSSRQKELGKAPGSGLSVTHGIVTGHGGTIQVESKPGHGTRFTIHLPLVSGTEARCEQNAFKGDLIMANILLVDDEPLVVETLSTPSPIRAIRSLPRRTVSKA